MHFQYYVTGLKEIDISRHTLLRFVRLLLYKYQGSLPDNSLATDSDTLLNNNITATQFKHIGGGPNIDNR